MSGPAGFLEFFILEASDYVEQLDRLLLGGNSSSLDAQGVQRVARALRGTATMAKMPSFAELASSVERAGRAVQNGAVQWSPALGGVLVAAIDDLKTLLHSARTWSAEDDARAVARSAELARFVPATGTPTPQSLAAVGTSPSGSTFLATEATNIAAGVELLITRASDPDTAANVLRRIRALRGVASVAEVRPLAEVLETTEDAGRGLESGKPLNPAAQQVLESGAAYLRALAVALRTGADVNAPSFARQSFVAAQDAWLEQDVRNEVVVPIAELFYTDGTPGVVEAAPTPPTSAAQRFRLELVGLGEHLKRVVDSARQTSEPSAMVRARRELQRALRTAQASAESFGQPDVAAFIAGHLDATEKLDFLGLAALDDLAALLTDPGEQGERVKSHVQEVATRREGASEIGGGFRGHELIDEPLATEPDSPAPTQHVEPSQSSVPIQPTATVAENLAGSMANTAPPTDELDDTSAALIDSTIAALDSLTEHPLSDPVPIPEDAIVPIETLLYRGRAALDRAVELRDSLRKTSATDQVALDELFDLLELARTE